MPQVSKTAPGESTLKRVTIRHIKLAVKKIGNGSIPKERYNQASMCSTNRCIMGWAFTLANKNATKADYIPMRLFKRVAKELRAYYYSHPILHGLMLNTQTRFSSFVKYFQKYPQGE